MLIHVPVNVCITRVYILNTCTCTSQERVQQLNQRLDKLKLQLSDSQAREEASREEHTRLSGVVARLEGEVGERASQVGRLESECQQRRRALELAKTREQKLSQQIQEVWKRVASLPTALLCLETPGYD